MQEAVTYATGQTIAALGNSLSQKKEIMKGKKRRKIKAKEDQTYRMKNMK